MKTLVKTASITLIAAAAALSLAGNALAIDLDKAHQTAIKNCMNWKGLSNEHCTCVQDKVRTGLSDDSYSAMLQYAQAFEENRRADLAAMQVNASLSKALEPVDAALAAAEQACKG